MNMAGDLAESLKTAVIWGAGLNVPWFLAGAGIGVPAGVAVSSVLTGNSRVFTVVRSFVAQAAFFCRWVLLQLCRDLYTQFSIVV